MLCRHATFRPLSTFPLSLTRSSPTPQLRDLHQLRPDLQYIPPPTPFVPDVQTFLTLIGRGLSQHASKITSWRALFTHTSEQLRELGIEPPRSRRYLLRWRHRFRNGQFGIGGEFRYVKDGAAKLQVIEVPTKSQGVATATNTPYTRKIVVNVDENGTVLQRPPSELVPAQGLGIRGAHTIVGPHVQPLKGGMAGQIIIKEGLWEDGRGHKIDGGERRQAEVRAKRRKQERKKAR